MEIIFIIVSLGYLAIIVFLAITWYKDVKKKEDTDKRILVLEKRDAEKATIKDVKELYGNFETTTINVTNVIKELKERVGKLEKRLPKNNK